MARRYTKKTKKSTKKINKKGKVYTTPLRNLRKIIRREVIKSAEEKNVITVISDSSAANPTLKIKPYAQDPLCGVLSLTEPIDVIDQGTGQGDRIGNTLRAKNLRFKGYIYSITTEGGVSGFPTNVTMYIGRLKQSVLPPTATQFQNLLQVGDDSIPPTDDNRTSLYSINRDLWNVYYRRTFKIGSSVPTTANAVANNDYKALIHFNVNCTKWLPKLIRFDDTSQGSINTGLYVWFTISNYNDQLITPAYIPQVQYCAMCEFNYTDY